MANNPLGATTTIASGSDAVLDDDNHSTRVNTVAGGTASDGYASVSYRGTPRATFNGASQSAIWLCRSRALRNSGTTRGPSTWRPTMLGDGETPSVGAAVQPATLDYNVNVLANRQLTVAPIGTPSAPARAVLNLARPTTIRSGSDPLLDSDEAATRVNTVAAGTAAGYRMTVAYQVPRGTRSTAPSKAPDLAATFSRLGVQQGSLDTAPAMLSDGEAPSVGAVVQPATLNYDVNVVRPRRLRVVHGNVNFGNVLRGATVSDDFTVYSPTDSDHSTMVYVAPGGASLGPLTVGQTLSADRGNVSVPISGVLDTYMTGTVAELAAGGHGRSPGGRRHHPLQEVSTVRYRADVGIARLGTVPTSFGGPQTVLSAHVAAGTTLAGLSSEVNPRGTLAENPMPVTWVRDRNSLAVKNLYGTGAARPKSCKAPPWTTPPR